MASDKELAGLPEEVREAIGYLFAQPEQHQAATTIRAELVRLADECAELRSAAGSGELSILKDLAYARETIKRLNRRVQVAEAGVAEKVKESSGRSLGRSLANAAANIFRHERDEARAELAALKRRIADDYERGRQDGINFGPSVREQIDISRDLDHE